MGSPQDLFGRSLDRKIAENQDIADAEYTEVAAKTRLQRQLLFNSYSDRTGGVRDGEARNPYRGFDISQLQSRAEGESGEVWYEHYDPRGELAAANDAASKTPPAEPGKGLRSGSSRLGTLDQIDKNRRGAMSNPLDPTKQDIFNPINSGGLKRAFRGII